MPPRRRQVLRLASILAILGAGGPALAQPRVHRQLIPDLDFAEAVAPEGGHTFDWDRSPRALWQGVAETAHTAAGGVTGLSGKLRAGERLERDSLMRMRSAVRWRPTGSGAVLAGLEGTHDFEVRFGFGEPKRDRWGFDLGIEAHLDHSGGAAPALRPVERGPGALFAGDVGLEGAWRLTNRASGAEAVGLSFPVGVRMSGVDYRDASAAVAGASTTEASAAMAYQLYDRHALDGRVTFLSLTRTRTRFERADIIAARAPLSTQRELTITQLRVGDIDMVFFDDELLAGMRAHYGWAWLSVPGTERADNLFTFHYGVHVSDDDGRLGVGFGRNAAHTPDGGRLVADWRLELEGEVQLDRINAAAGLGASWLDDVEHGEAATLGRYSLDTELYTPIARGLELGVYHVTSYEPRVSPGGSFDPWRQRQGWGVETGLFVRARGAD